MNMNTFWDTASATTSKNLGMLRVCVWTCEARLPTFSEGLLSPSQTN